VTPSVLVNEAEPVVEVEEEGPPETPAPPEQPGDDPILKKAIEVATQGTKG
jgi:hypothetical protein